VDDSSFSADVIPTLSAGLQRLEWRPRNWVVLRGGGGGPGVRRVGGKKDRCSGEGIKLGEIRPSAGTRKVAAR